MVLGESVNLTIKKKFFLNPSFNSSDLILTFTDKDPHLFLRSLDRVFPETSKVEKKIKTQISFPSPTNNYHLLQIGLVGAMTPFMTGSPHTLFLNNKVYSGGAVGLAIRAARTRDPSASYDDKALRPLVKYSGLEALGDALSITK